MSARPLPSGQSPTGAGGSGGSGDGSGHHGLDRLVREAAQVDAPAAEAEVARIMQICNACRYCEGFCAVFPAMTRRLEFGRSDVHYLANLCHGCSACLHACQYAPPHEFAVAVPQAMARVRLHTWVEHAWPRAFGALYRQAGLAVALALCGAIAAFLMLAIALNGHLFGAVPGGDFYAIFPHNLLVGLFGPVFLFVVLALGIGVARFWREAPPGAAGTAAVVEAGTDVLSLRYLGGGHGEGCNVEDDAFSLARRRYHHLTFYGFMLCFASTSIATIYHYGLGWKAPYALSSVPVLLGTVGGLGLVVGPIGLLILNRRRHPLAGASEQAPLDIGLIVLLLLVSVTGLALLGLRETAALPILLATHLGAVMAFFLTMPYGKFAHGVYRSAALLKWAIEKRLPPNIRLGD
ncbi:MAG: tricarballylate utilization 4Fe-4S protein TcuB [Lautropia sp.]